MGDGRGSHSDVLCAGIVVADHVCAPVDHLPAAGERVRHEGWELEVLEMDRRRIASIRVTPPKGGR